MSSANANANANANKKMVNEPNLYIYIPRASLTTTENEVKQLINQSNIALVDYCDLVVVKDPKTKQPVHFSIFIKLIECIFQPRFRRFCYQWIHQNIFKSYRFLVAFA